MPLPRQAYTHSIAERLPRVSKWVPLPSLESGARNNCLLSLWRQLLPGQYSKHLGWLVVPPVPGSHGGWLLIFIRGDYAVGEYMSHKLFIAQRDVRFHLFKQNICTYLEILKSFQPKQCLTYQGWLIWGKFGRTFVRVFSLILKTVLLFDVFYPFLRGR